LNHYNKQNILFVLEGLSLNWRIFLRLAKIELVDSPLVKDAIELAQTHSAPYLFNHVMRSWVFAVRLAEKTNLKADQELLAVTTILHDLGLTDTFSGPERFEVDGANAARDFLLKRGVVAHDVQLVWDAIALHTTRSIALHKGPEVAMCHSGTAVDVLGLGLDLIEAQDLTAILAAYPRLSFKQEFQDCLCQLVRRKPDTTYDNFLNDMGKRYVSGYAPPSFADYLLHAPFAE
jgi:hypothetical protein